MAKTGVSVRGDFRVVGKQRLINKLREVSDSFSKDAKDVLAEGAEHIRDKAEQNAPVGKTGELQENIIIDKKTDLTGGVLGQALGDVEAAVSIGPDSDHFYGMFVEIGTKDQAANPWLRPAFDSQHKAAQATIRKELAKKIKEHTILGI